MSDIKKYLSGVDAAAIAADLIAIPSFSFMPMQEQKVAEHLRTLFAANGVDAYLQEVVPGRPNVIARIKGGDGPSLMLCGHMDTVPAYDMADAFTPRVENGVLHGRGACDMKGAVAAMAAAMIAVKKSGAVLAGDLIFAGLVDEEEGGTGAEYIADNGPYADAAIIGEPTDMHVALGHKGLEWIAIDVLGRKVHGGDQAFGVNAIQMAARLVNKIYDEYAPLIKTRTHPVLGSASINIGRIEGGDQPSTVAGACRLLLDRRDVPGETRESVYAELRDVCAALHAQDPAFCASVYDLMEGKTKKPHYPYCLDAKEPIVQSICTALEESSVAGVLTAFPAWSDAGTLSAYTHCRPLVCGPGHLGNAHSVNDSVSVDELRLAAEVYARTALLFLKN